ncbi:MAG: PP2C family serine/threonine-protein phosphatase [Candidatus Paceibacterota bacterium]
MNSPTSVARQGPRPYQEDRHYETYIPDRKWLLLAIMDGHGGADTADFCEKNIFRMMPIDKGTPKHSLRALVVNLNSATRQHKTGSTFSGVIISEKQNTASVAILGDSPVVILDDKGQLHISPEHNVRTNIEEREAAIKRGGEYSGGYIWINDGDLGTQGLQMSRALGDVLLGRILSREPETYNVYNPVWVLVASDGLFDPSHKNSKSLLEEMKKFAKSKATADTLMAWAEKRGLEDNATAVVWNR